MLTFKEFIAWKEGLFIPDGKAEQGKSKTQKPLLHTPSSIVKTGVAGGPGNPSQQKGV